MANDTEFTPQIVLNRSFDKDTNSLQIKSTSTTPTLILDNFGVNNLDNTSTASTVYIGMEDKNGVWCIKKLYTASGLVITYATVVNNPTLTTYALAWAAILTATYSTYSQAF